MIIHFLNSYFEKEINIYKKLLLKNRKHTMELAIILQFTMIKLIFFIVNYKFYWPI